MAPLSLKTMGLLDKKSAPLLGVNGKLDDQAPIADVYLLLEHGNPKSARVYPEGHHMGRTPGQHPDEIANTIVGWLKERLGAVALKPALRFPALARRLLRRLALEAWVRADR